MFLFFFNGLTPLTDKQWKFKTSFLWPNPDASKEKEVAKLILILNRMEENGFFRSLREPQHMGVCLKNQSLRDHKT